MSSPINRLKVLHPIVECVAADVVHDEAGGNRPVDGFPVHYGTQPPDVRLGHLYPRPRAIAALRPVPNANAADREFVVRRPRAELRCWRAAFAQSRRAGTLRRAVVDHAAFRWPTVEDGRAHRTNEVGKRSDGRGHIPNSTTATAGCGT
jgi:hypothetical protein